MEIISSLFLKDFWLLEQSLKDKRAVDKKIFENNPLKKRPFKS
jgi:hypothetical protein